MKSPGVTLAVAAGDLEKARDAQDRAASPDGATRPLPELAYRALIRLDRGELATEGRPFAFESGKKVRRIEHETYLRAGHTGARRFDDKGEIGGRGGCDDDGMTDGEVFDADARGYLVVHDAVNNRADDAGRDDLQ